MIKFCAGIPLSTIRNLRFDEVTELRQGLQKFRAISFVSIALLPFGVATLLMVLASLTLGKFVYLVDAAVIGVVILVLACILARVSALRAASISKDLARGHMAVFEGSYEVRLRDSLTFRLVRKNLLHFESSDEMPQSIELLPISTRIVRVNGIRITEWVCAEIAEFESDPSFGAKVDFGSVAPAGHRPLSWEECNELSRLKRRLLAGSIPVSCVALFFGYLVFFSIVRYWPRVDLPVLVTTMVLSGVAEIVAVFLTSRIRQIARDVAGGEVQVHQVSAGAAVEGARAHDIAVESLPASGLIWTIDGHIAQWRTRTPGHVHRR